MDWISLALAKKERAAGNVRAIAVAQMSLAHADQASRFANAAPKERILLQPQSLSQNRRASFLRSRNPAPFPTPNFDQQYEE